MTVGYYGVYGCDYLNRRFPLGGNPTNPKTFFGHFDSLALLCYLLAFAGACLCLISVVWIVIAAASYLFSRKHPKQA